MDWKKRRLAYTITTAAAMLAASACGEQDAKQDTLVGTVEVPLQSWSQGMFLQILRVNSGETLVRNKCSLTVPLSGAKPLTFSASSPSGVPEEIGWTGQATSGTKLSVSGCAAYPCEVTALFRDTAANGIEQGCQVIADDGNTRLVGTSTGAALTVQGPPTAPVIFNQDVKIGASGTPSASKCVLQQTADLTDAEVTDFSVSVDGTPVLTLQPDGGATPIGAATWPTEVSVPFGTLIVGREPGATRLKHVTARHEQLPEGAALRCAGQYHAQTGTPVFDVNVSTPPTGSGLSLSTEVTGWTCDAASFGTGNGCDCDCGIVDPDCPGGAADCAIRVLRVHDYTSGPFACTNLEYGETAAVTFTAAPQNVPYRINKIRVLPCAADPLVGIDVWQDGDSSNANPEAVIYSSGLTAYFLAGGTWNEIDLSSENIVVDVSTIRVGFTGVWDAWGVATDGSGIVAQKNTVRSSLATWNFAENLGVTGDFIMEVDIEPQ